MESSTSGKCQCYFRGSHLQQAHWRSRYDPSCPWLTHPQPLPSLSSCNEGVGLPITHFQTWPLRTTSVPLTHQSLRTSGYNCHSNYVLTMGIILHTYNHQHSGVKSNKLTGKIVYYQQFSSFSASGFLLPNIKYFKLFLLIWDITINIAYVRI